MHHFAQFTLLGGIIAMWNGGDAKRPPVLGLASLLIPVA